MERKALTLWNAFSHSGVHSNVSFFFIEAKNAKALSPTHERNLDKVASLPVRCCTSLTLQGLLMFNDGLTFVWGGLDSSPSEQETQEFPHLDPESAFGGVQSHVELSDLLEDLA